MRPGIEEILKKVRIYELPQRAVSMVDMSTPLGEVYRLLDEEHSVAVLVLEEKKLVGIFTERDILYRTALEGDPATPIGELMTRDAVTLRPDDRLAEAIAVMTEKGIRHLPIVSAKGETGLIGGRDVLRLIADYYPETVLNLPPRLNQKMSRPEGG
ncbi:MAG: CBS domain-containing protein [Acidobacteriota bacterium]|nr:CBS domain-containing protein [Acidobacteriota bacterium]